MPIEVFNTSIIVYPYEKEQYPTIEKLYTAVDNFTKEEMACGYFIDEGRLYLPRGTSISKLEDVSGELAMYSNKSDPIDSMSRQHHSFFELKDPIQEESVEFLVGRGEYLDTKDAHQKSFSLKTGGGKTFCSAYAITELNQKALIVTHKDSIKTQWMRTFTNMFDYKQHEILNISGSDIMEKIMDESIDSVDVYFVNHQTLHSYLSRHNPFMTHEFFKKLKIGLKVYDEAHLEFMNILFMDAFSNTDKTWYVTATFERSDRTENKCFKNAFNSVIQFGQHTHSMGRKHVIYHACYIHSRLTRPQLNKVLGYRGMSAHSYTKFAFFDDPFDTMYRGLHKVVDMIKDKSGKKLIFVGLISAADKITERLKKDFPVHSIGTFHSGISKDDKEDQIKKDIIVTTIKSCGVGTDIKGLRFLVNCEPFASRVLATQLLGRLREVDSETDTYMFDIIDMSVPPCDWWYKARSKKIIELAKQTIYLTLDD